jgi:catechol 2,3-dioxygenase-like lactoylglutathione lyase family enzyme
VTRLVGINHVAIEVGDIDEALAWYRRLFDFKLRGRVGNKMAFLDMGDQFIAISAGREQSPDEARHFGLVVDDREEVRSALMREGIDVQSSDSVDFLDPWGNHIQIVDYRDIQFAKSPTVLAAMDLAGLEKSAAAREEMRAKGLLD